MSKKSGLCWMLIGFILVLTILVDKESTLAPVGVWMFFVGFFLMTHSEPKANNMTDTSKMNKTNEDVSLINSNIKEGLKLVSLSTHYGESFEESGKKLIYIGKTEKGYLYRITDL